jgi:hypothetical protein
MCVCVCVYTHHTCSVEKYAGKIKWVTTHSSFCISNIMLAACVPNFAVVLCSAWKVGRVSLVWYFVLLLLTCHCHRPCDCVIIQVANLKWQIMLLLLKRPTSLVRNLIIPQFDRLWCSEQTQLLNVGCKLMTYTYPCHVCHMSLHLCKLTQKSSDDTNWTFTNLCVQCSQQSIVFFQY